MDDLVTWLRAQLDEDERVAREAVRWNEGCTEWADAGEPDWEHIARHDPARVLREVEAKRVIVEDCVEYVARTWGTDGLSARTLVRLALPYADRPGYRDEWRP